MWYYICFANDAYLDACIKFYVVQGQYSIFLVSFLILSTISDRYILSCNCHAFNVIYGAKITLFFGM